VEKPIFNRVDSNPRWGNDRTILDYEPVGKFAGIQKADGQIFVAVNDTQSTANLGLLIFTSTDNGENWASIPGGVNYRGRMENVKMIRTVLDSFYCFFQAGNEVYCWNFLAPAQQIRPILYGNNAYRSFDVAASSTGAIYVFMDSLLTNNVVRYSTINGGFNWGNRGSITSNGANPKISMSGTGDTLLLNYYGPVLADTATSVVRLARYRETAPGILASAGFIDIATDPAPKYEYMSATNNSEMWFIYTSGAVGARSIWARKSITAGVSWDAAFAVTNNTNLDYFGQNIKFHSYNNFGFDLVYQADSTQVGPPNNETDYILFSGAAYGSAQFTGLTNISDFPPAPYTTNYSSQLVTLNNTSDVGVIYVGMDGNNKKLYWDRLLAVIPVELTSFYSNAQNNNVLLNWTTATEVNNKGFFIERKSTKGIFNTVAFIQGNGTTTERQSYTYADNNLEAGKYFYRLKQVDLDGTTNISNTIEVEVSQPSEFSLSQNFPNPFNPDTKIKYSIPQAVNSQSSMVNLKVYDVLGNEVATLVNEQKAPGAYEVIFDASKLSSGIYFYKLNAGSFSQIKKMTLLK
ncbi:MAG: T9SS type A sorting domain-containing protein, partial [Ignavibacteriaceae bacterium]|nr:T9SS type A sorting domain-containing protein [Ignavibacteriaceae bacterium]